MVHSLTVVGSGHQNKTGLRACEAEMLNACFICIFNLKSITYALVSVLGNLFSSFALGIRIFDHDIWSTDATESAGLVHKIEMVDVYSNSWGPGDMGWEIKGPDVLASRAIKLGIEKVLMRIVCLYMLSECECHERRRLLVSSCVFGFEFTWMYNYLTLELITSLPW